VSKKSTDFFLLRLGATVGDMCCENHRYDLEFISIVLATSISTAGDGTGQYLAQPLVPIDSISCHINFSFVLSIIYANFIVNKIFCSHSL
jgi:hypothetical protein